MVKLVVINLVVAVILLFSTVSGISGTLNNISKYGWSREETEMVNGKIVSVSTVSSVTELVSCCVVGMFGFVLLANIGALWQQRPKIEFADTEGLDVEFPKGKPKVWDVWYDPVLKIVGVTVNEFVVMFPLGMVLKWDQGCVRGEEVG